MMNEIKKLKQLNEGLKASVNGPVGGKPHSLQTDIILLLCDVVLNLVELTHELQKEINE